jgi:hypothetical protein
LLLPFALAFLVVILTLSEAEGEGSASRLRSKRPFFPRNPLMPATFAC